MMVRQSPPVNPMRLVPVDRPQRIVDIIHKFSRASEAKSFSRRDALTRRPKKRISRP
jgi:hypothetical protein